jgi:hypothetical protein
VLYLHLRYIHATYSPPTEAALPASTRSGRRGRSCLLDRWLSRCHPQLSLPIAPACGQSSFISSWRRQTLHTPYNKLNGGAGCTKQNPGQIHMECGVGCTATVKIANSLSTDLNTHPPSFFSVVARLSAGPPSARWPYDWFIGSRSPKGETLSPRPLPATGIMIICFR